MPSEKVLEQKKQIVAELSESLKNSCIGVIVNYKGITVEEDTKLRKQLRETGEYKVVKNTLLKLALKDAGIEGLDSVLEGTTAIALSKDDYTGSAKALCDFADKSKTFEIKAGFVDGKVIDVEAVKSLAKLPSKEVLVAQVRLECADHRLRHGLEWHDEGPGCRIECYRRETSCECIIVFICPAPQAHKI